MQWQFLKINLCIISGCRLLTKLSQHHKTVTCLRLGSNGKRILSGSLDRHVKIYDVATYQVVHTLDFTNAVLSLGVAQNDQTVVAGMVDGLISIQNMETDRNKGAQAAAVDKKHHRLTSVQVDHEVLNPTYPKQAKYNEFLRKYEYVKCLNAVMLTYVTNKTPEVTVSVMQELIHRKGLARALAGRDHKSLARIIRFICNHIGEHRFMRILTDVGMTLLDVYEDSFHEFTGDLGNLFMRLSTVLQKETALTYELLELQGSLELLLAASNVADQTGDMFHFVRDDSGVALKQSSMAKESSIVTV